MSAFDIKKLVERGVYSPLGYPNLPVEVQVDPLDWHTVLTRYYTFVPLTTTRTMVFPNQTNREQLITMDSLLPDTVNYFYIGIVGITVRNQMPSPRFDEYLLGLQVARPVYDPLQWALSSTLSDLNTGEVHYEEDWSIQSIRFISGTAGILQYMVAYGHTDPAKLPLRHLTYLVELMKTIYYKRILAIRKTGSFSGSDFTINVDLLEEQLKAAEDSVLKYQENIGLTTVARG